MGQFLAIQREVGLGSISHLKVTIACSAFAARRKLPENNLRDDFDRTFQQKKMFGSF